MKFTIISPVRNEEKYIRIVIECMLKQTLLPFKWVIVNDGSTDNTDKIVKEFVGKASFIKYLTLPDRGCRHPGRGVVEAFYQGVKLVEHDDYDVIAKFDGDLKFPLNALEIIGNEFSKNLKLGVTGATRYDRVDNSEKFRKAILARGSVGGCTKFYRKKCFEDIGGLIRRAGWDGVDTIRASMKGWETGEIEFLKIYHLRPTGTAKGEGLKRACCKYGDISYYMGGYLWYFILRAIGRSLHGTNPRIGFFMIVGYLKSRKNKLDRETPEFRNYLKRVQRKSMINWGNLALNKTYRLFSK